MKIEATPIQFHPSCQFDKLKLTELQTQYLSFLRLNKSIYELVQHNLSQGWLVSFTELYALVAALAKNSWITNPEIKDYFQNINIANTAPVQHFSSGTESKEKFDFQSLLQLPFFRSLDPQLSQFLIQSSRKYSLKQNTFVCKVGDDTRNLFVLLSGQAGVYKNTGTVKQLIALLGPSSIFGEAGFLLGEKRSADVITLKNSEVLVIPHSTDKLDPYLNREKATQLQYRFWVQHALLHSELFKSIPSDCLDALTFAGKVVELKQDKILFRQGDKSDAAYILIQGEVIIEINGKKIGKLSQGASVGEISLMAAKGIRTATVSSTKDSLLLEIKRDEFYKLLSQNLFLAKELEHLVHHRLKSDAQRA